jgi:hypothetical protein
VYPRWPGLTAVARSNPHPRPHAQSTRYVHSWHCARAPTGRPRWPFDTADHSSSGSRPPALSRGWGSLEGRPDHGSEGRKALAASSSPSACNTSLAGCRRQHEACVHSNRGRTSGLGVDGAWNRLTDSWHRGRGHTGRLYDARYAWERVLTLMRSAERCQVSTGDDCARGGVG